MIFTFFTIHKINGNFFVSENSKSVPAILFHSISQCKILKTNNLTRTIRLIREIRIEMIAHAMENH